MRLITMRTPTFVMFLAFLALTGCGDGGGSDTTTESCTVLNSSDPGPDTDGDQLPDCYEVFIGTSPASPDSDGDGLTDYDEVVTKAFDPTIDNFRFNPRVADVPDIRVQLVSVPDFEINFKDSTSNEQTLSLTTGNRRTTTLTNSYTYAQSVGEEISTSLGATGGTSGFNVSSGITYSKNQQETMSWTDVQSEQNSSFRETTESETSQRGVTNTGGVISVDLRVENLGDRVITLESLTVTARQVDSKNPTRQKTIKGMDYDTAFGAFPTFDIAGGTRSKPLSFTADLTLGKIYDLLSDSRNLIIEPTTWRIVDDEGRSYTHAFTNVNARAAQIIIDYGGVNNREIENHYVATVTDFGQNRISAATAMTDILKRTYTEDKSSATYTGNNNGLLSILDVSNNDAVNGRWVLIHNFLDTDSVTRLSKTYDINRGAYSLKDIQIAASEVLHFMYFQDRDGDGLGSREEFIHGTQDDNLDTDNDGLTDFEEIKDGWDVPITQGLTRKVYSNPLVSDADNDTLLDGAERSKGTNPNKRDTDNDGILDITDTSLTLADMQEVVFLPLAQTQFNDTTLNADLNHSGSFGYTADRFGNANAAVNITADNEDFTLSNIFSSAPSNGASLVMWVKVDPTLPTNGWSLYEHDDSINISGARQFFWIFPSGFTVFGDGADRHSVFASQNELFTTLHFADWHMLAVVGEEDVVNEGMKTFRVYYDGELYTSVSHPTTLVDFALDPWIFAGPSSYNVGLEQFRGAIDDIRFFKRALDSEEIRLLFEAKE